MKKVGCCENEITKSVVRGNLAQFPTFNIFFKY